MSLRLVLDTNVRISALITPKGICANLITAIRDHDHVQLISASMLDELHNSLALKFRGPHPKRKLLAFGLCNGHVDLLSRPN